jgi:hypothetical protein
MTNFTHPIELSDKELDLVAAGGGGRSECGCQDRSGDTQIGLVNVDHVNVGVNILGFQNQFA